MVGGLNPGSVRAWGTKNPQTIYQCMEEIVPAGNCCIMSGIRHTGRPLDQFQVCLLHLEEGYLSKKGESSPDIRSPDIVLNEHCTTRGNTSFRTVGRCQYCCCTGGRYPAQPAWALITKPSSRCMRSSMISRDYASACG